MLDLSKKETNQDEDLPTLADSTLPLPILSATYEGFGQGITNLAAAASIGLRIPLSPLYVGGAFMAAVFTYLKVREAQNRVAVRREMILAKRRALARDHHRHYWSAYGPDLFKDLQSRDLKWIIDNLSAEEIAICLGYYYRIIVYGVQQYKAKILTEPEYAAQLDSFTQELALKITAESAQLNNPKLSEILNWESRLPFTAPPTPGAVSYLKQAWYNLRKYYKSILSGAATAGGLTVIIVESALSTATLTLLFPWSILIILGALIAGGITGYILDKYLDGHHKNDLKRIRSKALEEKNTKTLGNLWVDIHLSLRKLESTVPGISIHNQSHYFNPTEFAWTDFDQNLHPIPDILPDLDYSEVRALKKPSHIKRKVADFILPTLIAARQSFSAVSTVFAGFALAGLILPWWPVLIMGGTMLGIYVLFKIINNRIKHQSEEQRIQNLNTLIPAEKFRYWNSVMGNLDTVQYSKENNNQTILTDLDNQYQEFVAYLRKFESYNQRPEYAEMIQELSDLHMQLLMCFRTHADNLNDKNQQATLFRLALTAPIQDLPVPQLITLGSKIKKVLSAIDAFLVRNLKDIVLGFALGFGTSLTVFAFLGLTSMIAAGWPLAVIAGACLVGIGIRVAIRHGIKALRNQRLHDIENQGEKPILDKKQLMDCRAETAVARTKVDEIAAKWIEKKQPTPISLEPPVEDYCLIPVAENPATPLKKSPSNRPLLWIEKAGSRSGANPADSLPIMPLKHPRAEVKRERNERIHFVM